MLFLNCLAKWKGLNPAAPAIFFERNILAQIEVNKFDGPLELTG